MSVAYCVVWDSLMGQRFFDSDADAATEAGVSPHP